MYDFLGKVNKNLFIFCDADVTVGFVIGISIKGVRKFCMEVMGMEFS